MVGVAEWVARLAATAMRYETHPVYNDVAPHIGREYFRIDYFVLKELGEGDRIRSNKRTAV
jgi:hypothetical protein